MTEYRCRYCHEPIPPALAQSAIYRRQTPTFCRRSHNTLHKQRKRRFEAKGLAGDELAAALAVLPKRLKPAESPESATDTRRRSPVPSVAPTQGPGQLTIDAASEPDPVRAALLAKLTHLASPWR